MLDFRLLGSSEHKRFNMFLNFEGWINELLSWSAFVPLSRISFIMYLLHINVEGFVFGMYPSNLALTVTTAVSIDCCFKNLFFQ